MSQRQFDHWKQRLSTWTTREHQSPAYLLNNLVQAFRCNDPQVITESQRSPNGRMNYRIKLKLEIADTVLETESTWESSVGVAKRKASLFILETLFQRYGASAEEIAQLRENAASFEGYQPPGLMPGDVQCPICPDVGGKHRLAGHLREHIKAEVDAAERSARATRLPLPELQFTVDTSPVILRYIYISFPFSYYYCCLSLFF